jgi:hypothetical protein
VVGGVVPVVAHWPAFTPQTAPLVAKLNADPSGSGQPPRAVVAASNASILK